MAVKVMTEDAYPPLLISYLSFCKYRASYKKDGVLDLSEAGWFYPTTLLPLAELMNTFGPQLKYKAPKNRNANGYLSFIMSNPPQHKTDSYIPIILADRLNDTYVGQIYNLICGKQQQNMNQENTFKYIIGELVANIDEHSKCNRSIFMAQMYTKSGFLEAAFFDNGITIGGSFREAGIYNEKMNDADCLTSAIKGTSTKKEGGRGRGLPSTIKILKALNSDIWIVSGKGAIYLNGTDKYLKEDRVYRLDDSLGLNGTLISFRIHPPINQVNIYEGGYL